MWFLGFSFWIKFCGLSFMKCGFWGKVCVWRFSVCIGFLFFFQLKFDYCFLFF